MFALHFAPANAETGIREPYFEPVTGAKISTICDIANNACEHFSRLFDCQLSIDVFEAVVVPTESQPALFSDALVFRAHGHICDALIVIREASARRIVSLAFREEMETPSTRFSALEERVLERVANELAVLCGPFCGDLNSFGRVHGRMEQYHCATYFELRLGHPVDAVIGVGLSHDPVPTIGERIPRSILGEVQVNVRARLARSRMSAREVSRLSIGSVIAFDTKLTDHAQLLLDETVVAHGECGDAEGQTAFNVLTLAPRRSRR